MKKTNIEIETTGELQLTVKNAVETTQTSEGYVQEKECICFVIDGYNPKTDRDVEEHVFFDKEEAMKLIEVLTNMISD